MLSLSRLEIIFFVDVVTAALAVGLLLVLQAPPGAGKTTRVPPALLQGGFAQQGRIVMLEPRRLAARAAARRMAQELGDALGVAVTPWDERLTTTAAQKVLVEADLSRKKRKGVVDKVAATLILQGYLQFRSMKTG